MDLSTIGARYYMFAKPDFLSKESYFNPGAPILDIRVGHGMISVF